MREKGGTGFPYLVFMDADGNVLAKQGQRTVEAFEKTLQTAKDFLALEKKAKSGDRKAGIDALIAGMELGRYGPDEAKEMLGKLGPLPKDKQKVVDDMLVNAEVEEMTKGLRSQEQAVEVGKKFIKMAEDGRVPTGRTAMNFYMMMMAAQEAAEDVKGYEKSLDAFRKLVEGEPRAARALKRCEDTLEKLKAGKG